MSHEIHQTLVLSTAHLSAATCQLLSETDLTRWPVAGGPTGAGFYIYAHDEFGDDVPQDLADCLIYTRVRAGCDYVHFDRDVDTYADLPIFDHEARQVAA
jgi:hypothetical protein